MLYALFLIFALLLHSMHYEVEALCYFFYPKLDIVNFLARDPSEDYFLYCYLPMYFNYIYFQR